ncbi:hypothetical protein [Pseudomonas sp. BC42]|uniref:hypothetical protein n=1 Tax=Pseudomonas sp. BC42 TaxID=2933816 RepID=UPI001F2F7D81|nr:hypothetical protein [Pseudomonas sp. BC42]ULT72982.1 hypothetical protein L1O02_11645 [Pseudomonas sp. BC42]
MPTETQHLEQRVAALQSDLNARDQALDDAATENNERELSRRDWFEEAQRLQAELDKRPSQIAMSLQTKIKRLQAKLAERDVLLRDVLDGKHTTPGWNQRMKAAISASAELGAKPQAEPVYMVRTHGSCCWEEVGSGSLEDFQSMPEEYELRALYTHPAEQPEPVSSTSDKYKAELYDEVWQLARGMGYGNVTDALMKLQGNKP